MAGAGQACPAGAVRSPASILAAATEATIATEPTDSWTARSCEDLAALSQQCACHCHDRSPV